MIRLKDIAARAKVSTMTVSKALRDAKDISATTKARIKTLALQMGYVPNTSAASLRTRTTRLLGLVIGAATNPLLSRVITAIQENAHEAGYDLILTQSQNNPDREAACIRRLLARRVDGLFIAPAYRREPTAPVYEEVLRCQTPTVLLGPRAKFCSHFPNVETDDTDASQTVTRHLIELGHRRIAFLAGPAVTPWAHERFDGYRRALREAGREVDESLVFTAGGTIEEGEAAALQMLNEGVRPTAVQAVNDLVAIGAANTFLNQGVRIPADLSVAGFGNILVSEHFRVPLTTVRQPKFRLGVAAMEMMLKLLRGERVETRRLRSELLIRASTAPPKA